MYEFDLISGRELRCDQPILAEEIMSCDRTIRNKINQMADHERKRLVDGLVNAAKAGGLCLSPDVWTDNHRRISYLGATAHYVDEAYRFHSIDLFCVEFKATKKTGEEICQVSDNQ